MKWISGNKDKPEIDNYDHPIEYIVRFKGDDPRTGWVDVKLMTAEEIHKVEYSDYWEWLQEYKEPEPKPEKNDKKGGWGDFKYVPGDPFW